MASAKKVSLVVQPEVKADSYVLQLDRAEASALFALLYAKVDGTGPARDQFEKISYALASLGGLEYRDYAKFMTGHAHCETNPQW